MMKIGARILLMAGNVVLGIILLSARPRSAEGEQAWPRTGCCKLDTSGNGVCCIDCCTAVNGCTSSTTCPKKVKT